MNLFPKDFQYICKESLVKRDFYFQFFQIFQQILMINQLIPNIPFGILFQICYKQAFPNSNLTLSKAYPLI